MRIALIGHGLIDIPPPGWGAVESTIWARKGHLEAQGHDVDIYNTTKIHQVVHRINQRGYDFVHCHNELFAWACTRYLEQPYALTSHFGGWHQFVPGGEHHPAFEYLFQESLRTPAHFALSPHIVDVYRAAGYEGFLRVQPNSVEAHRFRFDTVGNRRAVCLGAINVRKRQAWLAGAVRGRTEVDFVGPVKDKRFRATRGARHLGAWDRDTVEQRLTEYSCLVLVSRSEAAPKVVLEALAAGLNVVTTPAGAVNLDAVPFVSVVPEDDAAGPIVVRAIQEAVEANPALRHEIRQYAVDRLDGSVLCERYLENVAAFQRHVGVSS
jgi:glycosyltransferase involved in cell wall biosynthesis